MKKSWLGRILLAPTATTDGNGQVDVAPEVMESAMSRLGLSADVMKDLMPELGKAPAKPAKKPEAPAEAITEETSPDVTTETTEETPAEETTETTEETPKEETTETTEAAPEFTPEQQAWVDTQVAAATTKLSEVESTLAEKQKEVEQLTATVQQLKTSPVAVADLHPLLLADDVTALNKAERQITDFENWAFKNWDGTAAIEANGTQPAVPAYTAEEIRARYADFKAIKENILPQARAILQQRQQVDGFVKETYPELLDPKSQAYQVVEGILRKAPGLKAIFPNIKVIIGDAIAGEKIRLEKAKARKAAAGGKTPVKPAPKVPVKPSPASRTQLVTKPKSGGAISASRFMELGGDRNALVAMIAGSNLVS